MKWLKSVIIGIIAIAFISFISIKWLEKNGFCTKKFAFLPYMYTNQELIDKAILYYLEHQPNVTYKPDGIKRKIRRYTDIEEFKKMNPDCCKLNYSPDGPLESSTLYGWVYLTYYINFTDDTPPIKSISEIEYNSCGRMKEFHD